MITGDSQAVADSVARRLGIDEVAAQVLPADKAAAVKRFQEGGRKVAMVGDGVNDAPALATADVGIAIGAGTDVAVESAGIVLVRSDPRDVVAAIELSRATYSKMVQNLVWATGYNLVAIPVAMGLFVPWGIDLPMAVGAIAMSLSTIIVAANAQLLRRVRLRRESHAARLTIAAQLNREISSWNVISETRHARDEANDDATGNARDDEPNDRDQSIVDRPRLDPFCSFLEGLRGV